jgi:FkbM family methyltransferase
MKIAHTRYGQMIVNEADSYIGAALLKYGEYAQGELDFLLQLITPDSVVVDIGANIGAMTVAFASKAKTVFAFEPHPRLFYTLAGNLALNEITNVIPYNIGISDHAGRMSFQDLPASNNGAHSLTTDTGKNSIIVSDQVPACSLLKIDVEGMELQVLKGCTNMIQSCHPVIFIENDRRDKAEALVSYLINDLKYDMYWVALKLYNEDNYNQVHENVYGDTGCINMIGIYRDMFDFTSIGLKKVELEEPVHEGTIQ